MPEGTIKRLTDRGFGFIDTGSDQDIFLRLLTSKWVRARDF